MSHEPDATPNVRGTRWYCQGCGHQQRQNADAGAYPCPQCGSSDFANVPPPHGACPECAYQADD